MINNSLFKLFISTSIAFTSGAKIAAAQVIQEYSIVPKSCDAIVMGGDIKTYECSAITFSGFENRDWNPSLEFHTVDGLGFIYELNRDSVRNNLGKISYDIDRVVIKKYGQTTLSVENSEISKGSFCYFPKDFKGKDKAIHCIMSFKGTNTWITALGKMP